MLMRRVVKFALSNAKIEVTKLPKAPTLLSGELENFRFDAEHSSLYDGYTLDELYGSKIGVKHSPAVKAEMRKYTSDKVETPSLQSSSSWLGSASSGTCTSSTPRNLRNSALSTSSAWDARWLCPKDWSTTSRSRTSCRRTACDCAQKWIIIRRGGVWGRLCCCGRWAAGQSGW